MNYLVLHRATSILLIALALLLHSTKVNAQPVVQCTPQSGYVLNYVNGVRTGPEDAILNMAAITRAVGPGLRNGLPVEFKLVYNPTGILAADFFETLRVKAIESSLEYSGILAAVVAGQGVSDFMMTTQQREAAQKLLSETRANWISRDVDRATQDMPDLQAIIATSRGIDLGKSLILIGHSEGTVFTSLVYRALLGGATPRRDETMRLISVGAAASEAPGLLGPEVDRGQAWVTSTNDLIMNLLRIVRPSTLPANYSGPLAPAADFPNGHSLADVYLNPDFGLRQQVINRINTAFQNVAQPTGAVNCELRLGVTGQVEGWQIFPVTRMSDFQLTTRSAFSRVGSPGNTCTNGERGTPLYSLDTMISPEAALYGSSLVTDAPQQNGRSTNRRPCSSFMAIAAVPDPQGVLLPRYRIWANATARSQTFSASSTTDWEAQLRFDSGDPWLSNFGARCVLGMVSGANFFSPAGNLQCVSSFVVKDTPL